MDQSEQDLLRRRRLQAMGLVPKDPAEDPIVPPHQDSVQQAPGELNPLPLQPVLPEAPEPEVPQQVAVLPTAEASKSEEKSKPISFTFNVYPNDESTLSDVIETLARTFAGLCSLKKSPKLKNTGAVPKSIVAVHRRTLADPEPNNQVVPLESEAEAADRQFLANYADNKNDSWMSYKPLNQSTPKTDRSNSIVHIPSDDSLLSEQGAVGPAPETFMNGTQRIRSQAGERRADLGFPQPSTSRKFPKSTGNMSLLNQSILRERKLFGSSQAPNKTSQPTKSSRTAINSSSSSEFAADPAPKSKEKGSSLMAQMANFFKMQKEKEKDKDKSKPRGLKHLISDSEESSASEVMPAKKMRVAPKDEEKQEPKEQPADDDPYMGRCSVCLDRPKNCKIRCRHVYCEPCLIELKRNKQGCPQDGFKFRKWEKLF